MLNRLLCMLSLTLLLLLSNCSSIDVWWHASGIWDHLYLWLLLKLLM